MALVTFIWGLLGAGGVWRDLRSAYGIVSPSVHTIIAAPTLPRLSARAPPSPASEGGFFRLRRASSLACGGGLGWGLAAPASKRLLKDEVALLVSPDDGPAVGAVMPFGPDSWLGGEHRRHAAGLAQCGA